MNGFDILRAKITNSELREKTIVSTHSVTMEFLKFFGQLQGATIQTLFLVLAPIAGVFVFCCFPFFGICGLRMKETSFPAYKNFCENSFMPAFKLFAVVFIGVFIPHWVMGVVDGDVGIVLGILLLIWFSVTMCQYCKDGPDFIHKPVRSTTGFWGKVSVSEIGSV